MHKSVFTSNDHSGALQKFTKSCFNFQMELQNFEMEHVTDCSQTTYDHWLQLYDEDIDKYLEAVNQEHIIDLN